MKRSSSGTGCVVLAALGFLVWCAPFAQADYVYDEAIDGDLPHPNSAFILPFGTPNPNTIRFTLDDLSDGWILQVDPGETLKSFTLTAFTPDHPDYTATFHMYDGPSQTDPVLGTAWERFGVDFLDRDFMDFFGIEPLGAGQYLFNFWFDNSPNPTVEFDINMTGLSPVEATTWCAIKSLYR
jgi:hypothetical protein